MYSQPLLSAMCRHYQENFSESQGGRKEGHRTLCLPSPHPLDNDSRTKVSDVTTQVTRGHVVTPMGPPGMMGVMQYRAQYCAHVYCAALYSTGCRGQFVGVSRCDNM